MHWGMAVFNAVFMQIYLSAQRDKRDCDIYWRENDRRKGKGDFMTANKGAKNDRKKINAQTKFVVTREFGGTQTMQEAFERLIEKKTEEHISRRKDRQAV